MATEEILVYIAGQLRRGPYLLGEAFSPADILFGSTFALFKGSPLMPAEATIDAYVERVTTRPAYQRAAAKDAALAGT